DINGDGLLDVLIGNQVVGEVSVFLYNGGGSYAPEQRLEVGAGQSALLLLDLDGDGDLDLTCAHQIQSDGTPFDQVTVLKNNGDGAFDHSRSFTVGTAPTALAGGDLNGDGVPDLAVSDLASDNVAVLLSQP